MFGDVQKTRRKIPKLDGSNRGSCNSQGLRNRDHRGHLRIEIIATRLAVQPWAISTPATQDDMTKIETDGFLPQPAVLHEAVKPYQRADLLKASWQLVNTLGAYALLWLLMVLSLSVSWWLIPPLIVVTAGLAVRIFIIFHDCCHGSFFQSQRANAIWGFVCGALVFTPYHKWRREHTLHHATAGNLDRRGTGDHTGGCHGTGSDGHTSARACRDGAHRSCSNRGP